MGGLEGGRRRVEEEEEEEGVAAAAVQPHTTKTASKRDPHTESAIEMHKKSN